MTNEEGEEEEEGFGLQPPGFLDDQLQQTAELHPAYQYHSERDGQSGGGCARQRAV